jgi:LEA14-like dessication related protein
MRFAPRALAFAGLLLLSGCAGFSLQDQLNEPRVSLTSIEILELSGFSARFGVNLNVQNPNPLPIPIQGISYSLQLNDNLVASGVASSIGDIEAYGETEVRLEASTNLFGMLGLLQSLMSMETAEVEYQLESVIDIRGFSKSFEWIEAGVVPLDR